jgi:two-component system, cell cycle sensor histidine kinase and response regulator CckA
LNYSRATPYGQTREYLDVNDLIEDVVSLVGVVLLSGINFQVKLTQSLPLIKISRSQFQQIVMNLVINAAEAIDFPEQGEIILSTGKFRATKMVHSTNVWQQQNIIPGDYVFLQVSDNGKGIPPETLENIFTPFYSTKPKGRGLGLSTVMDVVKNHNGYITLTSKVGRGTVFRIYFPSYPEKFSPIH